MYTSGQEILDKVLECLDYAHRYSNYVLARCPFHDDHRPSFFVYEDTYRCASCGAFGKTSNLLAKINPTGSLLAPVVQDTFHNPWTKWMKRAELSTILTMAWKLGQSVYLRDRGIETETQKKLGIGLLDDWVTFPIKDVDGKVVGGVARAGEGNNSIAKYVTPSGQSPNLLYAPSWKRCFSKDTIFVTFGIVDAVTLYALGYAAVSTTSGKRVHPSAFDFIRKKIVFIPDMNEERDAMIIASQLGWRGKVARLPYPIGTKDINDTLRMNSGDEWIRMNLGAYA